MENKEAKCRMSAEVKLVGAPPPPKKKPPSVKKGLSSHLMQKIVLKTGLAFK